MSTVIDMQVPGATRFVWLASVRGRLNIEINTGLKFKGRGILTIINEREDTKFRKKTHALVYVEAQMEKYRATR